MKYTLKREFIDGWDFTETDDHGNPIMYSTYEDAEESLNAYIDDINEAYAKGYLAAPYQNDVGVFEVW
jgi:tetrahydromethanopterin S-methyltransferase subunit H